MQLDTTKTLYDSEDYQEALGRIDELSADSTPEWGKMSVGQMLAHCAEVTEVYNGKPLEGTPFYVKLMKGLIRKVVVAPKAFQKKLASHPQYIHTESRDFETEKVRLLSALEKFKAEEQQPNPKHALLGTLTNEEKGWSAWKHLDHHLRQFGV